jgi:hypothetical protein
VDDSGGVQRLQPRGELDQHPPYKRLVERSARRRTAACCRAPLQQLRQVATVRKLHDDVQHIILDERIHKRHHRRVPDSAHALHFHGHLRTLRLVQARQRHALHHEQLTVAPPANFVGAARRARAEQLQNLIRLH